MDDFGLPSTTAWLADAVRSRDRVQARIHRIDAGDTGERATHRALHPMRSEGWTVLVDRAWPGSVRAQIDFIAVGPTGVFIVDAKRWADAGVRDGRLLRRGVDRDRDLDGLRTVAERIRDVLEPIGLARREVHVVVALDGASSTHGPALVGDVEVIGLDGLVRHLADRPQRLSAVAIAAVVPEIELRHPPRFTTTNDVQLVSVDDAEALFTVDELDAHEVSAEFAKPIESWMAFLHPAQLGLATRSYTGPSRITGTAGTGKTVVALHRAAHLARQGRRVLFTSHVASLLEVHEAAMRRLAPEVAHLVTFRTVHSVARRVSGRSVHVDESAIEQARSLAWMDTRTKFKLEQIAPKRYWDEEVDLVIKSRGIRALEAYRGIARVGRRRPLSAAQRDLAWQYYRKYEQVLTDRGAGDWNDVVRAALEAVLDDPERHRRFDAVIVDEAQDLTCDALRLIAALAGDGPDALTLVGDGRQSIYGGGTTLGEAGISVRGRGTRLTRIYRSSVGVLAAASAFSDPDDSALNDDDAQSGADVTRPDRDGPPATVEHHSEERLHDEALVQHVMRHALHGEPGEPAVLAATRKTVARLRATLQRRGIATVDLADYRGETTSAVKIGTIHRAKGLEFKHVVVADVPSALLDADDERTPDPERHQRARREYYVAATRARDTLWIGVRDDLT